MQVLVIADQDLDGTGSATIITKYWDLFVSRSAMPPFKVQREAFVSCSFPSRSELNEMFEDDKWVQDKFAAYDRIYICDTAPNSEKAIRNIGTILAPKVVYFDHHDTNRKRLLPFKDNFLSFNIEEGDRCSAKLTFDTLYAELCESNPDKAEEFKGLRKFALLVNDLDMWYRKMPRSTELADFVAVVGPVAAYTELQKICYEPDTNTEAMTPVLDKIFKAKNNSLALAKATLVKHEGYKSPFYTCLVDDWSSWVAAELVAPNGLIAMFDIARKSLSFRVGPDYVGTEWHRAPEPKPNCLDFAELLGGGGHPQASGVSTGEASPIFKALSQRLGEILLEVYSEATNQKTPQVDGKR
jgi:oligoribonuclease NrnB/cAMP/cGMP phosphodiesterase (DHH superfamily)